jgi:hypothetical protein
MMASWRRPSSIGSQASPRNMPAPIVKKVLLQLPEDMKSLDKALDSLAEMLANRDQDFIRGFLEEVIEPVIIRD